VAENAGTQRTVAVAALEDADNAAFHTRPFFGREPDHVPGEAGIKLGRHIDVVPLHASVLVFARVKARRQENGSSRVQAGGSEPFGVALQVSTRLLQQECVFGLVQGPELGLVLPGLQVDVPYALAVRAVDTDTCVPNLFFIAHLARVRVDIVEAEIANRRLFPPGRVLGQADAPGIVLPCNRL
jgi:hypothetical protein